MKEILRNQLPSEPSSSSPLSCRQLYFFHEKNTGISRFHVAAGPNGKFPLEEAVGLLAMHCVVLGQSPQDYVVMVRAARESLEGLAGKVEKLLQAGYSASSLVKLTRRQEEVLSGVMQSLANKENCRFAECVREHREVPPVGVASRARPERVGIRGHSPHLGTNGRTILIHDPRRAEIL